MARPRAGAPVMWDMIWEQGMEQGRHCHCHWSRERALERVAAIAAAHAADGNAGNQGADGHVAESATGMRAAPMASALCSRRLHGALRARVSRVRESGTRTE